MQRVTVYEYIHARQKWLEHAQKSTYGERRLSQPLWDANIFKKSLVCALNTPECSTIGQSLGVEGVNVFFFFFSMPVAEYHETDAGSRCETNDFTIL